MTYAYILGNQFNTRPSGALKPPFTLDLSRWLEFDSNSLEATDQIGDETRPIQPDNCITSDGNGGGVKLSETLTLDKWAVGFRVNSMPLSVIKYICNADGDYQYTLRIDIDNKLSIRQNNAIPSLVSINSIFTEDGDYFIYNNNENVYIYRNGTLVESIISVEIATLKINTFLYRIGYIFIGNHYDYRLFDLSSYTPEQINTFFSANAPLFHSNSKLFDEACKTADFKYHQWAMDEGAVSTCFDSGTEPTKIHGTYFYYNENVPVDTLHNKTIYPINYLGKSNLDGWNKAAYFNGVDSEIVKDYNFNPNKDFFIELYYVINQYTNENWDGLISLCTTEAAGYTEGMSIGIKRFLSVTNEENLKVIQPILSTPIGELQFLRLEYTLAAKTIKLYRNKVFQGQVILNSTELLKETTKIVYGYQDVGSGFFNGILLGVNINDEYIDPLNGSTIGTPINVDFNKIIIPNDSANEGFDIFGRESLYKGRVKFNGEIEGGYIGNSDGSGVIGYDDLTGVTIVSSNGTATPTINGNNIEVSVGTIYDIVLSNGDVIDCNNHLISRNGVECTNTNITFTQDLSVTPQSTKDWNEKGGYILSTGEYIPNPKFPLPAGATLIKPKGFNWANGSAINFDPTVWETYKSYGDNLFPNGIEPSWTTVGDITLTDNVYLIDTTTVLGQIYTAFSGYLGKKIRLTFQVLSNTQVDPLKTRISDIFASDIKTDDNSIDISTVGYHSITGIVTGTLFRFKFDITNGAISISNKLSIQEVTERKDTPNRSGNLVSHPFYIVSGTGTINYNEGVYSFIDVPANYYIRGLLCEKGANYLIKFKISNYVEGGIKPYTGTGGDNLGSGTPVYANGTYYDFTTGDGSLHNIFLTVGLTTLDLSDIELYKLEPSNAIGYMAHQFFNFLATESNTYGLAEIHPFAMSYFSTINEYPYYMTKEIYDFILANKDSYATEYQGYIYFLEQNDWNLINAIVYNRARTVEEQDNKLDNKWLPNYDNLLHDMSPSSYVLPSDTLYPL